MICYFKVIFGFYCVQWVPVKYGEVEYPMYAHVIGLIMSLASMLWIPGYAIYYICRQRGSLRDVSWQFKRIITISLFCFNAILNCVFMELNLVILFFLQRIIKGITPDIKSNRVNAPPKKMKPNLSGKFM